MAYFLDVGFGDLAASDAEIVAGNSSNREHLGNSTTAFASAVDWICLVNQLPLFRRALNPRYLYCASVIVHLDCEALFTLPQ